MSSQCDLQLLELKISLRQMELFKIFKTPWSATNTTESLEETYHQNSKKSIQACSSQGQTFKINCLSHFKVLAIQRLVYTLNKHDPDQKVYTFFKISHHYGKFQSCKGLRSKYSTTL